MPAKEAKRKGQVSDAIWICLYTPTRWANTKHIYAAAALRQYLLQLLLRGETQTVDGVRPAVGPLAKLLGRFGERHVGGDGAVDDSLWEDETYVTGDRRLS